MRFAFVDDMMLPGTTSALSQQRLSLSSATGQLFLLQSKPSARRFSADTTCFLCRNNIRSSASLLAVTTTATTTTTTMMMMLASTRLPLHQPHSARHCHLRRRRGNSFARFLPPRPHRCTQRTVVVVVVVVVGLRLHARATRAEVTLGETSPLQCPTRGVLFQPVAGHCLRASAAAAAAAAVLPQVLLLHWTCFSFTTAHRREEW
jgi:hypothetical protein